jgi:hypothetical protein
MRVAAIEISDDTALKKQMRIVAMKATNDTASKKTDENYCHKDFR